MMNTRILPAILVIAASLLPVCGRAEDPIARAELKGPEGLLYDYHKNLLATLSALLETTDPNSLMIVCDILNRTPIEKTDCETLKKDGESTAQVQYTFLRDHARLEAFILSWARIQTQESDDELFTIKFDILRPPADCASYDPKCYYNAACAGPPRRCDMKPVGPPCEPCPTN